MADDPEVNPQATNTTSQLAVYMAPVPADVYDIKDETSLPSVATGINSDPLQATTNTTNGGLPLKAKEPYPTGTQRHTTWPHP